MITPRSLFMLLSLFALFGCSKKQPQEETVATPGLPAWVVGDTESLPVKRSTSPAYLQVEKTVSVLRPRPLTKIEALEKLNPGLSSALPQLAGLLSSAEVSPKFKSFYDAKISAIKDGDIMSTDDYFDCATVLHLTSPATGRKAVLFQSDMDVDTDGTDPVRLSRLQDYDDARISRSFQPLLAYSWAQSAGQRAANPFVQYYADTLSKLRGFRQQVSQEAAQDHGYIWQSLQKQLDETISSLDRRAKYYDEDLRTRRSLVGSLDPFIVVPQTWPDRLKQPFSVQVGDFVAVIAGGKVYPCVVGDTGGDAKMGEASQRVAQAINPKASGRNSAADDVSVTYVIFPQTRLAMTAPDLSVFQAEVARLLQEMGGLGAETLLHHWQ
ncbi:glycoside hydrolase family 75 protein [Prosthecobacter sp.]|uniref:glycoside hydrolase family 75 protein n=1 Tax=Prosthecobacter sp. TaxID=1965333 RepID=UPI003783544D